MLAKLLSAVIVFGCLQECFARSTNLPPSCTNDVLIFHTEDPSVNKNSPVGYKTSDGEVLVEPQYEEGKPFCGGLAAVKQKGLWGYINKFGEVIIPFQFPNAGSFSEQVAPVKIGTRWTYIGQNGVPVCEPQFVFAHEFSNGLAPVKYLSDGLIVADYINHTCQLETHEEYEDALTFDHDLGAVKRNGLWGFVNPSGTLIIDTRFDDYLFYGELQKSVALFSAGKWGFSSKDGSRWLIPPSIDELGPCYNSGRLSARVGSYWGSLDTEPAWVIKPTYLSEFFFCLRPDLNLSEYPVAYVRYQFWTTRTRPKVTRGQLFRSLFPDVPSSTGQGPVETIQVLVTRLQFIDIFGNVVGGIQDFER